MYAILGTLKKPDHVDTKTFRDWWFHKHVSHVKAVPGLRHYVIYPIESHFNLDTGKFEGEPDVDGAAVLWFDSKDAAEAAMSSNEGQADRSHLVGWKIAAAVYGAEVKVEINDANG